MTQEALKLALEALQKIYIAPEHEEYIRVWWPACEQAITAIKEALREHAMREVQRLGQEIEQEPVGDEWTPCIKLPVIVHVRKQRHGETHVSTREGITPVNLEDLIMRGVSGEEYPIGRAIFEQTYSLDTTPPQLEERNFCPRCGKRTKDIHTCTPPQRTWVGLTDEEIDHLAEFHGLDYMSYEPFTKAIEAKLKDKNNAA